MSCRSSPSSACSFCPSPYEPLLPPSLSFSHQQTLATTNGTTMPPAMTTTTHHPSPLQYQYLPSPFSTQQVIAPNPSRAYFHPNQTPFSLFDHAMKQQQQHPTTTYPFENTFPSSFGLPQQQQQNLGKMPPEQINPFFPFPPPPMKNNVQHEEEVVCGFLSMSPPPFVRSPKEDDEEVGGMLSSSSSSPDTATDEEQTGLIPPPLLQPEPTPPPVMKKRGKKRTKRKRKSEPELIEGKLHVCSFCPSTFNRRSNMLRHERIHKGVRPFVCHACPRRFGRSDHLRGHVRHVHGQEIEGRLTRDR